MRKILSIGIMILLVFSMSACEEKSSKKSNIKTNNIITEAKLTERETAILSATSEQSFVYDFKVDPTYKKVSVWVEKYESGKLVGEVNRIDTEIKNKGMIIFSISKKIEANNSSLFWIGIQSDNAMSSGWFEEMTPENISGSISGSNSILGSTSFKDKEILAFICYSNGESSIRTPSSEFFSDADGHIDELKNYGVVYLLKSEFSNEKIE